MDSFSVRPFICETAGPSFALKEKTLEENYNEILTSFGDIQLLREQSENFVELMFFQIKMEDLQKKGYVGKAEITSDLEISLGKIKQKINAVKNEIERRDQLIQSRISLLHRAIEESQVIILSAEMLKGLMEGAGESRRRTSGNSLEICSILDQIIQSSKENARLVKAFAQMSLSKGDWVLNKVPKLPNPKK
jgi:hypothetical protein